MPGAVWAPAWVVWRYGDGYVSWAPMPIQYIWNPYVSYTTYYFDFDRYISWDCWVITRERDFPRRNKPRKWLPLRMNREILHRTRYADPLRVVDRNVVNRGVSVDRIEQATGLSFKPVAPTVVTEPFEGKARERRQKNRDEVLIYRPIDNQPTAEALRDEAESDKALAERIHLNRQLSSARKNPAVEPLEPRRPGRLIGQPKPLDYHEAENPLSVQPETHSTSPAFLTLPNTEGKLPEEPAQIESVDQPNQRDERVGRFRGQDDDRIREQTGVIESLRQRMPPEGERKPFNRQGSRIQESAGQERMQLLDLERQQQAEEKRMQERAIRQQKEVTRPYRQNRERYQQAEQERMQQEVVRQ